MVSPLPPGMDLATVVGLTLSSILVLAAIVLGGSPGMFLNIPSMLIVVGGTIGASLIQNPLKAVLGTVKVVGKAFSVKVPEPEPLIGQITDLSRKARKEGMLALESIEISYDFLAKGVSLCVDGVEPQEMRGILEMEIVARSQRHIRGREILQGMGGAAPAFGMIGTLIGLVQMLATLDDPSSIGPAMAVALLTTLYGALIANVFCLPLADKLKVRALEEQMTMTICLEGVMGLSNGDNPNALDQKLRAILSPEQQAAAAKGAEEAKAA